MDFYVCFCQTPVVRHWINLLLLQNALSFCCKINDKNQVKRNCLVFTIDKEQKQKSLVFKSNEEKNIYVIDVISVRKQIHISDDSVKTK